MRHLLRAGADCEVPNGAQQTPAFAARSPGVARMLVQNGCNLEHKDWRKKTPLMNCIEGHRYEPHYGKLIEVLVTGGARVDKGAKASLVRAHETFDPQNQFAAAKD